MINWRPEYIALLNRLYWMHVIKRASQEAYEEANRVIGRAAHVTGRTVERWITGERRPNRVQGERLVRWAATVRWWVWEDYGEWERVTLAEKLSELIRDSKTRQKRVGGQEGG